MFTARHRQHDTSKLIEQVELHLLGLLLLDRSRGLLHGTARSRAARRSAASGGAAATTTTAAAGGLEVAET